MCSLPVFAENVASYKKKKRKKRCICSRHAHHQPQPSLLKALWEFRSFIFANVFDGDAVLSAVGVSFHLPLVRGSVRTHCSWNRMLHGQPSSLIGALATSSCQFDGNQHGNRCCHRRSLHVRGGLLTFAQASHMIQFALAATAMALMRPIPRTRHLRKDELNPQPERSVVPS